MGNVFDAVISSFSLVFGAALASLETGIRFADDIDSTAAFDDLEVTVARFGVFQRG